MFRRILGSSVILLLVLGGLGFFLKQTKLEPVIIDDLNGEVSQIEATSLPYLASNSEIASAEPIPDDEPLYMDEPLPETVEPEIQAAVYDTFPESGLNFDEGKQYFSVVDIDKLGDWALVQTKILDKPVQRTHIFHGIVVLARRTEGKWIAAFPGRKNYYTWMDEFPEELLPASAKTFLRHF